MRIRLGTVACILASVATLAAQSSQTGRDPQQPVFRSETDFIRVDMYATRDGQLVTDLLADEVQILEDGVRQRIETFEYVHIPSGPGEESGNRLESPPGQLPDDARARVFVVFVDTHTTQLEGEGGLRLSLVRFLDQLLGPRDLVGLMTPDMSAANVTLSRRSTVISDVANDDRWIRRTAAARHDLKEFAWENCYGSPRGPSRGLTEMKARHRAKSTINALQSLVTYLRDLREERKAVLLVTGGWPFIEETVLTAPSNSRTESDSCAHDRQALARTDYNDLLEDLTKSANRANVSFYPVNSRQSFDPSSQLRAAVRNAIRQRERRTDDAVHGQLRSLAEETDGLAEVKTRNFDGVTQRIISDTSSYYLIGYQSTNPKLDGRFRNIEVRLTRPGVRVRARPGYGGETSQSLLAAAALKAPVVEGRVATAMTVVEQFDAGAPFWGRSSVWSLNGGDAAGGAFWFVGQLGPQKRAQLPWSAGATADIVVVRADKTEVLSHTVELGPDDSAFTLRVPREGALARGDYSVRVRLRPVAGEDLQVSDSVRVTLDTGGSALGQAILWRRGPSTRAGYARTADPRFRRNEGFRVELPTSSQGAASASLLDRMGRPLQLLPQVSDRADESGGFRWIVVDAPIAALAPGDYAVEVIQEKVSQVTAFRVVP